jgi:drug/metabolite transporter (DMT)-like permease
VLGLGALRSGWTWLGIVLYVLATVSWLHVLRLLPLAIAYGLINVVHVLVPLGAWLLLHEAVSPRRWLGIALILAGLVALSRPAARAEEEL